MESITLEARPLFLGVPAGPLMEKILEIDAAILPMRKTYVEVALARLWRELDRQIMEGCRIPNRLLDEADQPLVVETNGHSPPGRSIESKG